LETVLETASLKMGLLKIGLRLLETALLEMKIGFLEIELLELGLQLEVVAFLSLRIFSTYLLSSLPNLRLLFHGLRIERL